MAIGNGDDAPNSHVRRYGGFALWRRFSRITPEMLIRANRDPFLDFANPKKTHRLPIRISKSVRFVKCDRRLRVQIPS